MTIDPRIRDVPAPGLTLLFDIVVDLAAPLDFGAVPIGRRILFGSTGGSFVGERLRGTVLPGGGDWAVFGPSGAMALDVRLTLRTDDGALLHLTYGGRLVTPPSLRAAMADLAQRHTTDPAGYYFRTTPMLETGDPRYAWLNDTVCLGSGYVVEGGVAYRVFAVG